VREGIPHQAALTRKLIERGKSPSFHLREKSVREKAFFEEPTKMPFEKARSGREGGGIDRRVEAKDGASPQGGKSRPLLFNPSERVGGGTLKYNLEKGIFGFLNGKGAKSFQSALGGVEKRDKGKGFARLPWRQGASCSSSQDSGGLYVKAWEEA